MRKVACTILLVLVIASTKAITKRALVIGIGNYPVESGWKKINGDKDIPLVVDYLVANGFAKQNIVELKNEKATSSTIGKEIASLISKSQKGDVIYIHFSGHGQQVTDLNGDEEDGFDEAWIPYDAGHDYQKGVYEGEHHIIDDQLNKWLLQLRTKVGASGKIVVVADACHSGGGSRAEEDDEGIVIRGSSKQFILPGVAKPFSESNVSKIQWIFISACKSYQNNYEYKGNGSLTYALSLLKDKLSTIKCQNVLRSVRSTISSIITMTQTPVLETTQSSKEQTLF